MRDFTEGVRQPECEAQSPSVPRLRMLGPTTSLLTHLRDTMLLEDNRQHLLLHSRALYFFHDQSLYKRNYLHHKCARVTQLV